MLAYLATDAAIGAGRAPQSLVRETADGVVQPRHRRRRHLDQRLVRADRHRARRPTARSPRRRPRLCRAQARDGRSRPRAGAGDRARRRGRDQVHHRAGDRRGAAEDEAVRVAKTIAHSPLVKTAFFASDPNLGRLLMAIGNAGIDDLDTGAGEPLARRRAGDRARRPRRGLSRRGRRARDAPGRDRGARRARAGAAPRRPSGPATSPMTTSKSTRNTAPDRAGGFDQLITASTRLVDRIEQLLPPAGAAAGLECGDRLPLAQARRPRAARAGRASASNPALGPAGHRPAEGAGRAQHAPVRRRPAGEQRAAHRRARHRQELAHQGAAQPVPRRGPAPDRGRQAATSSTCRTSSTSSPRGRSASSSSATTSRSRPPRRATSRSRSRSTARSRRRPTTS